LDTVGLFRIAGNKEELETLKEKFDSGKPIEFSGAKPHTVCTLIKQFLRALPEPLLLEEHFDTFCTAVEKEHDASVIEVKALILSLPGPNVSLLKHLLAFCGRVVIHSQENKMNADNIASLLAPNILYKRVSRPDIMLQEAQQAIKVVRFLILHQSALF